jgi:peroxiredoxin
VTELGELRKSYDKIAARGVEVVAVSVDPPEVSERLRRRLGLEIRFLSDPDATLMDPLHIRHRGGRPGFLSPAEGAAGADIFLPTTFLLDGDGVIRWIYRPDTYRVRASPREVLAAIDAARAAR